MRNLGDPIFQSTWKEAVHCEEVENKDSEKFAHPVRLQHGEISAAMRCLMETGPWRPPAPNPGFADEITETDTEFQDH